MSTGNLFEGIEGASPAELLSVSQRFDSFVDTAMQGLDLAPDSDSTVSPGMG